MGATWKTKDGTRVLIAEMTDTHLVNAANMVLRAAREAHRQALDDLTAIGSMLRGEMATWECDREFDAVLNTDPDEVARKRFAALFAEVKRRGLDKPGATKGQYEVPALPDAQKRRAAVRMGT